MKPSAASIPTRTSHDAGSLSESGPESAGAGAAVTVTGAVATGEGEDEPEDESDDGDADAEGSEVVPEVGEGSGDGDGGGSVGDGLGVGSSTENTDEENNDRECSAEVAGESPAAPQAEYGSSSTASADKITEAHSFTTRMRRGRRIARRA